jgi:hypothetical protein
MPDFLAEADHIIKGVEDAFIAVDHPKTGQMTADELRKLAKMPVPKPAVPAAPEAPAAPVVEETADEEFEEPVDEATEEDEATEPEETEDEGEYLTREDLEGMKWQDLLKTAKEDFGIDTKGIKKDALIDLIMATAEAGEED